MMKRHIDITTRLAFFILLLVLLLIQCCQPSSQVVNVQNKVDAHAGGNHVEQDEASSSPLSSSLGYRYLKKKKKNCNTKSRHQDQEQSQSLANPNSNKSLLLSKEFVERAVIASELSYIAFDDNIQSQETKIKYNQIYDEFIGAWNDNINDVHLLVKHNNVCYGVIRGTYQPNILDQIQNIIPFNTDAKVKSIDGSQCHVRKGFYYGHYTTSYIQEFRRAVELCVTSCSSTTPNKIKNNKNDNINHNCPLVLTGQSQGASIAIAASLDKYLKKFNPTTIAFGPLKTITNFDDNQKCKQEVNNQLDIYTFINASGGYYDDVPFGIPIGRTVGHVILVDGGSDVKLSYVGRNDNRERTPGTRKIHAVELYRSNIQNLLLSLTVDDDDDCNKNGKFPFVVTQWPNGHWCTKNDECISKKCNKKEQICDTNDDNVADTSESDNNSNNQSLRKRRSSTNSNNNNNNKKKQKKKKASKRTSGTTCDVDTDCESRICYLGRCTLNNGKLGLGSICNDHSDCDTGRCRTTGNFPWDPLICSPLRDIGMWCRSDSDCIENNCSGKRYFPFLDQRCQPSTKKE